MKPIIIKIPQGCILDPSLDAAVVGGNVQTSQRVVDVILKAFGASAASQGCMNNITFGDDTVGYYETVAGGAGAVSNLFIMGMSWIVSSRAGPCYLEMLNFFECHNLIIVILCYNGS